MEEVKTKVLLSKLEEWLDSDVSRTVANILKNRLDVTYNERAELLIMGEAQKTQEQRMYLLGAEKILQDMIDVLLRQNYDILEEDIIREVEEN